MDRRYLFENFVAVQIYHILGNLIINSSKNKIKFQNISLDRLKEKTESRIFSAKETLTRRSDTKLSKNYIPYSGGMHNFFAMKQLWINTIIVSKSKTSFLLNRKKLEKFLPRCNAADYSPNTQDLLNEQLALVSLMSGHNSRSIRNSKNAHR